MEIFIREGFFGGGQQIFVNHDGHNIAVNEEALCSLLYLHGAELSAIEQSSRGIEVVDHDVCVLC